jgi:hypothetical protein
MAMNPQFTVSGPFWDRVGFNRNGRSWYNAPDASGANAPLTREQFLAKYPGYAALDNDPAQAYKIDEALREERDRREGLLFKSNKNFVANMYNPYMAQMTGMGSGYPSAGY